MKPVSSRTVCDFFYFLFWFRVITAVLAVFVILFTVMAVRKGGPELYIMLLTQTLVLSIVVVDALFTYTLCERALKPGSADSQ